MKKILYISAIIIAILFSGCKKNNIECLYYNSEKVEIPNEMNIEKYSIGIYIEKVPSNVEMYKIKNTIINNNGYCDKVYTFEKYSQNKEELIDYIIEMFNHKINNTNSNWIIFSNETNKNIYIRRNTIEDAINTLYNLK